MTAISSFWITHEAMERGEIGPPTDPGWKRNRPFRSIMERVAGKIGYNSGDKEVYVVFVEPDYKQRAVSVTVYNDFDDPYPLEKIIYGLACTTHEAVKSGRLPTMVRGNDE